MRARGILESATTETDMYGLSPSLAHVRGPPDQALRIFVGAEKDARVPTLQATEADQGTHGILFQTCVDT